MAQVSPPSLLWLSWLKGFSEGLVTPLEGSSWSLCPTDDLFCRFLPRSGPKKSLIKHAYEYNDLS